MNRSRIIAYKLCYYELSRHFDVLVCLSITLFRIKIDKYFLDLVTIHYYEIFDRNIHACSYLLYYCAYDYYLETIISYEICLFNFKNIAYLLSII